MIIIIIMTVVCCIFSEKCRQGSRAVCCCCCDLGSTWGRVQEVVRRERENWDEYQMLRTQNNAHTDGVLPKEPKRKEKTEGRRVNWRRGRRDAREEDKIEIE